MIDNSYFIKRMMPNCSYSNRTFYKAVWSIRFLGTASSVLFLYRDRDVMASKFSV